MGNYRPAGVTIAAILYFFEAVLSLPGALWALAFGATVDLLLVSAGLPPIATGLGIVLLIFCVVFFAIGWGLLQLQEWARVAAIIASVVVLLLSLSSIPLILVTALILPLPLVLLVAHAWTIYYLFQPDVQAVFVPGGAPYPPYRPGYPSPLPPTERAAPPTPPPPPAPRPARLDRTRLVEERPPVMAWLAVKSGPRAGKQFGLTMGRSTIGRDATRCDIVLDDGAVSAEHAAVIFQNGQFVIHDLASLNGTFVNNMRVQRQSLLDGDVIRVGNTTFVYKKV